MAVKLDIDMVPVGSVDADNAVFLAEDSRIEETKPLQLDLVYFLLIVQVELGKIIGVERIESSFGTLKWKM